MVSTNIVPLQEKLQQISHRIDDVDMEMEGLRDQIASLHFKREELQQEAKEVKSKIKEACQSGPVRRREETPPSQSSLPGMSAPRYYTVEDDRFEPNTIESR